MIFALFSLITLLQARTKKKSLETDFSAYSPLHHLELPSDSQLLIFGVVLSSGYRLYSGYFLHASLWGLWLAMSPLALHAFAVVFIVLCGFSQAPPQSQKYVCWNGSSFRIFSSLLKGLREEVFASCGGLCDRKLLRLAKAYGSVSHTVCSVV